LLIINREFCRENEKRQSSLRLEFKTGLEFTLRQLKHAYDEANGGDAVTIRVPPPTHFIAQPLHTRACGRSCYE
jgi:hypothetical protein